jgi:hypothetical protein
MPNELHAAIEECPCFVGDGAQAEAGVPSPRQANYLGQPEASQQMVAVGQDAEPRGPRDLGVLQPARVQVVDAGGPLHG